MWWGGSWVGRFIDAREEYFKNLEAKMRRGRRTPRSLDEVGLWEVWEGLEKVGDGFVVSNLSIYTYYILCISKNIYVYVCIYVYTLVSYFLCFIFVILKKCVYSTYTFVL